LYLGLGAAGGFAVSTSIVSDMLALDRNHPPTLTNPHPVPSRGEQLRRLSATTASTPFDVLVIGGGATGTGCALDAVTRGLTTALIEREDFAAGTSSRSTKLVHGGVRYLEKAVKNLDYGQLKLVFEALRERRTVLSIAPHLTSSLPIMTPCYQWWEVPYYWAGLKAYDLVAGTRALSWSHFVPPARAKAAFPTLCESRHTDDRSLKGTIVYYDGQFNDSRLAVALACTAAASGAAVLNHAEVTGLLKDPETQRVIGVTVKDGLTAKSFEVYARAVVNATGPFADSIR
jgi:glycerol-3-phosphate dehydrogenase